MENQLSSLSLHPPSSDRRQPCNPQTFHPQTDVVRCDHTRVRRDRAGTRVPADSMHCKVTCDTEAVPARAHWLGFPLAQPHLCTPRQAEPGLPACSISSSPQALLSSQVKRLCALAQEHTSSWICDPAVPVLSVSAPKDSADPTAFQYLIRTLHKGR